MPIGKPESTASAYDDRNDTRNPRSESLHNRHHTTATNPDGAESKREVHSSSTCTVPLSDRVPSGNNSTDLARTRRSAPRNGSFPKQH
eukprot:3744054-Rhodomonas_salina.1